MAVSKVLEESGREISASPAPPRGRSTIAARSIGVGANGNGAAQPSMPDLDQHPGDNGVATAVDGDLDESALEAKSPFFASEMLGRCKSWLTSMIVHLVIIIGLALLTTNGNTRSTIWLEMGTDPDSLMADLEDLQFESADWESDDSVDETPEIQAPQELMEFQPELDWLDPTSIAEVDFSNPLAGDDDQMKRLSRAVSSEDIGLEGGGDSSFFGIETTGDAIIYIVDRSGSMQGQRWYDATRELMKSIESLKPEQKFFIFLFSSGCHPMPQLEGRNKMVTASKENIETVRRWLSRQYPDESTRPLSSVKRALNLNPDTIFLLTDGQFYDMTGNYLLKRAIRQMNVSDPDELVINTIAFHCDVGLEMLQDIALHYDGTFRAVE